MKKMFLLMLLSASVGQLLGERYYKMDDEKWARSDFGKFAAWFREAKPEGQNTYAQAVTKPFASNVSHEKAIFALTSALSNLDDRLRQVEKKLAGK